MTRGDFVQSNNAAVGATNMPVATAAAVEIKPAVLVQETTASTSATSVPTPKNASLENLPPLPKGGGTVAAAPSSPTKLLSPEEKARVVAELEALARGEPAIANADCTVTASVKPGTAKTIAAADTSSCGTGKAPKPAPRP